jgi:hypothetical protein
VGEADFLTLAHVHGAGRSVRREFAFAAAEDDHDRIVRLHTGGERRVEGAEVFPGPKDPPFLFSGKPNCLEPLRQSCRSEGTDRARSGQRHEKESILRGSSGLRLGPRVLSHSCQ